MRDPITVNDLHEATRLAWQALLEANDDRDAAEFIFRHGDVPSRLEHNDDGRLVPKTLNAARLRYRMNHVVIWERVNQKGESVVQGSAPTQVVQNMLAMPDPPLPVLSRIVDVPILGRDGAVHSSPGYSPSTQVYYDPSPSLVLPRVATRPSRADRARALDLIAGNLLGDFPFTGEAERAHAIALVLQPFVRELLAGPTPLYLIEAPTPGTGKSLLARVACWPAIGSAVGAMTEGSHEDEWRKRITAKLMQAPVAVLIDNLRDRLDSAALSAVLSADVWEDRILGYSQVATLPNKTTWIATGNNPGLSGELTRRSVRVRLDAEQEHPEDRGGFRHAHLEGWAAEHRGELVWAALTLARAWIAAGRPRWRGRSLGSFESWASVLGGILAHASVEGFLGNLDALRDSAQSETESMAQFLTAWYAHHGDTPVKAREIGPPAEAVGIDPYIEKGGLALGKLCAQHKDRRFGAFTLRKAGSRGGSALWAVEKSKRRVVKPRNSGG
jgi:putative DNA primase/helicase